jgi:predicted DNA-binding WGR domain protein
MWGFPLKIDQENVYFQTLNKIYKNKNTVKFIKIKIQQMCLVKSWKKCCGQQRLIFQLDESMDILNEALISGVYMSSR